MSDYQPCPKCGSDGAEKMSFTWWGGIIGPKLLTHVKCASCSAQFNGKTGRDNTKGIVIYTIAVLAIVGGIVVVAIAIAIAIALSMS